ncbi:hypothetical protein [Ruminococcus sp.]|uniref:hypothetical protein n=1 Tax=Ruminococcus sp. TaxID=41978 RepID=UPI0025D622C8|nr:hypothetical protein [Ruminococcus sp.]MCR4638509.1 hypothetical protein [Ruminococcus sp.]
MEKKLKNGADKIKMPADMKQRIISAAELAEKNRVNTDSDDYIEVVRSSERITTKTRIIKAVSAIAACAVLVGGIGTTGFLLHRQNKEHMTSGEVSDSACRSCPFGDFSELKYNFDANDKAYSKYSPETYEKLSDFLNCFNWGESVEAPEDKKNKVFYSGWQDYVISWKIGDTPPVFYNIDIANDGYVYYREMMSDFESGKYKIIEKKWYKIDFEAFNSGVKEILALDPVSQFGDFSQFSYKFDADDGKDGSYSDETYAQLSDFLNNFNWGDALDDSEIKKDSRYLKFEEYEEEYDYIKKLKVLDNEDRVYIITRSTPQGYSKIVIVNGGYVSYTDFSNDLVTDIGPVVADSECYKIDFEAFDRGVQEILAQDINKASPFGDFRTFDFMFCKGTDNYYNKSGEVYEKIADFLNNVDWGDKVTKVEQKIPQQVAEGMTYEANWENGDRFCFFYIENDGHVHYGENITDIDTHVVTTVADCNYYIDFEAFDKGITEILAKYKAEAPTEVFEYAELLFGQHERLTPTDEEGMAKFEGFVRNDFVKMLESTSSDDIVGGVKYSILTSYRLDDNKSRQENYFIFMDGFVECNECETDENGEMQLTNTEKYKIDVGKLESVLKDEIGVELPEYREININKVD